MLLCGSISERINGFLSFSLAISWKKASLSSSLGETTLHSLTELEINSEVELSLNLRRLGALKLISLSSKYGMFSFGVDVIHSFSFDVHATFLCILTADSTQ